MGCACLREKEVLPKASQEAAATMDRNLPSSGPPACPTTHRRSSVPKKNHLLRLPSSQGDQSSSPIKNRSRSYIPTTPTPQKYLSAPETRRMSCVSPRSPMFSGSGSSNTASLSWKDVNLTVKLREIRTVEEGLESCYILGQETEGCLMKATQKYTKKQCWVQKYTLRTNRSEKDNFQYFTQIRQLDHPNLLKIVDLIRNKTHCFLIYEDTEGGSAASLLSPIQRKTRGITEKWAAMIIRQVLAALKYCHRKGLFLKSLSLQHILFTKSPTDNSIQVKVLVPLNDKPDLNSPYIAPELLKRKYLGPASDLYSCGVVLSNLLISNCVQSCEDIETLPMLKLWGAVSPAAKGLIMKMIARDYADRGTVEDFFQHSWVAIPLSAPTLSPCLRTALRNMATIKPIPSLKKAFLQLMLNLVVSSEDLKEARKAFEELDTDLDGTVSEAELRIQVFRLFPEKQAEAAFSVMTSIADFSEDGQLGFSEFLLWAISRDCLFTPSILASTFRLLNRNYDRKVTGQDLQKVLRTDPDDCTDSYTWRLVISSISDSAEGCFDYHQFCSFLEL